MKDSILNFNKQFTFEPEIQNIENLRDFDQVILCGMGGSHLAADLIKTIKPGLDLYVHKDYDLPPYEDDFLRSSLMIACSYSGNTEETVSFMKEAYSKELNIVTISTGGEMLEFSRENALPFIQIPDTNIQPRQADGYLSLAILKFMGDEETILNWSTLEQKIKPIELEHDAEEIANKIVGMIPVVYSSSQNLHIAYNWKITLNETAKMPAFYNVFPELNHNEIQGFDNKSEDVCVIFLEDENDKKRIKIRMEKTKEIYKEKGINVITFKMKSGSSEEKVFNSILMADWVALKLAEKNNVDPEAVPTIEDFKKRLASN